MTGLHFARGVHPQRTTPPHLIVGRPSGYQSRRDIRTAPRIRRFSTAEISAPEPALSDCGQLVIYCSQRIRHHHANGHRDTACLIECLHSDAERDRNHALRDFLDANEPLLCRVANTICTGLEAGN